MRPLDCGRDRKRGGGGRTGREGALLLGGDRVSAGEDEESSVDGCGDGCNSVSGLRATETRLQNDYNGKLYVTCTFLS